MNQQFTLKMFTFTSNSTALQRPAALWPTPCPIVLTLPSPTLFRSALWTPTLLYYSFPTNRSIYSLPISPLLLRTTFNLPIFFLKLPVLQSAATISFSDSWFQSRMVLFTKEYSPLSVICFLALIFHLWSTLLRYLAEWSLSRMFFHALSPLYALWSAHRPAVLLRWAEVSQSMSPSWWANLAAFFFELLLTLYLTFPITVPACRSTFQYLPYQWFVR